MKKLLKDNLVKRIVFSGIVLIFVYWIFNNLAMFGSVIGNCLPTLLKNDQALLNKYLRCIFKTYGI